MIDAQVLAGDAHILSVLLPCASPAWAPFRPELEGWLSRKSKGPPTLPPGTGPPLPFTRRPEAVLLYPERTGPTPAVGGVCVC